MKLQQYHKIFQKYYVMFSTIALLCFSCAPDKEKRIFLKWNKSYKEDTIEKNIIALKWCFSFLGSNLAEKDVSKGMIFNDSNISINLEELGFNKRAVNYLAQLNAQLIETQEFKEKGAIDLGRYIALTLGNSFHYYKIAGVSQDLNDFKKNYQFDSIKGYINNSSISFTHRIISYGKNSSGTKQSYISVEADSVTQNALEFETVEVMPNGQLRFGIYDKEGNLKDAASPEVTRAGKPAKCIWCHETGIQPVFRKQRDEPGYLTFSDFKDSLGVFNGQLRKFQEMIWKDAVIKNRKLHTQLEVTYISFMEPSAERLSHEWGMAVEQVKEKLSELTTHRHEEFDFLGDLYHRKEVDSLAPWGVLEVPSSIREKSPDEVDLLN